ncbi:serine hydrolase [Glaciibacter superstes]|uniref:serine hydrolase n=1 Tax=Glaciibacter superstes TaxID=501023 RepID=UPI0003B2F1CD|nr:serine hydrolase [Glaciibacter superstes]
MHKRYIVVTALAAAMVTVLAGCSAPKETTIVNGDAPSQDVLAMPEGSVDSAVKKLPEIVKSVMERTGVPGVAVSVVHGGETVFAEGYGVRKKGEEAKVDADTVFQIASVSKSLGATVVATQVTQGVVDWTTPITDSLPEFELADPWISEHVTIGDFYSHRTGLPFAAGDSLEDIGYDRDYVIDHLKYQTLAPFRASYAYANFGITVGAEAVAKAAGTDWETLSDEQLYQPLGMDSTSSRHSDFVERENKATIHAKVAEKDFEPLYERNADPQSPAGGVSSSVNDMAKWMELILAGGTYEGKELVSEEALLPAVTSENISSHPQAMDQRSGTYGYGFGVGVQPSGRVNLSHSGAFSLGAATNFQMMPSADVGIVVLTNGGPVGAPEAITAEFLDIVQFGHSTRDWVVDYSHAMAGYYAPAGDLAGETAPANAAQAKPLSAYVGEYTNDYYGPATVTEENGSLVVAVGPDGVSTAELEPWDGDTFAFVPMGENAPEGSLSSVKFAATGDAVTSMTLDFFNSETGLLGTWERAD